MLTMETAQERPRRKTNWKREVFEWVLTFVCALAIALPVRAFVFSPFIVDGRSMNDTLADREVVFATKYDYYFGGDPERFDVVICRYPGRTENFVKRVVGLPGDTVEVRDGDLYVNGELCEEAYITHRPNYRLDAVKVPEGMYFVLGDNRSNSNDSHLIGPLEREQIVAHVRCVLFPFNRVRMVP